VAAARFGDPAAKERLVAAGVTCVDVDLRTGDLRALPRQDVDAVCSFAVAKTQRWEVDLRITAEAPGDLLAWCRPARSLHCSTTGVYRPKGHEPITEDDPLGDNHAVLMPTYSISKIAAESVVRFAARQFEVPTTIARLNVPYGDDGGWPLFHLLMMRQGVPIPVHVDAPSSYSPIHQDDITRQVPALLDAATLPVTTVNWGGSEVVSVETWCAYLGELTGLEPTFERTAATLESVVVDTTRLTALAGPTEVGWRDGFRRLVEAQG
jgi:nucleoside-diphosphate-sugar epimerase